MPYNEADTRANLIDPAIRKQGWTEDMVRREETAGEIYITGGAAQRRLQGRADYTLRLKVRDGAQPVAVALIEAKAESRAPLAGLEQGKRYARKGNLLHVPFVFSSNGHLFVEYDQFTGLTHDPRPIREFPTPDELRQRYEAGRNFKLTDDAAKPLLMPYHGGEASRRYYQDAAIRAVFEKIAAGGTRALLSLATGTGKTRIAVNLMKRIADAGQLRRALFLCDRDELRGQGLGAFNAVFGTDAAAVSGSNAEKNARVLVATYQTLGVAEDADDASFLTDHYPENYFSHIIIDECHRSAWNKWHQVLTRNPDAVQIGLTATPRKIKMPDGSDESGQDEKILADNVRYFGEPVYEYDIAQGMADGYLAACEVVRRPIFWERQSQSEAQREITREDLAGTRLTNALTGEGVSDEDLKDRYSPAILEGALILPERVKAMADDLWDHLMKTGGPEQKTIIFCARDTHADRVAADLNNLYAIWCARTGRHPVSTFAFKCTGQGGSEYLADLRGMNRDHFIACTVDLLSTGVDVPCVRNIVFFKYVKSPISFYQMVGRGTRLDAATDKMMFRVYDYTNATRLFGEKFLGPQPATPGPGGGGPQPPQPPIMVEGVRVEVHDGGRLVVTQVDGVERLVTVEEYRALLAARLREEADTLEAFRRVWIVPEKRKDLLHSLPEEGRSAAVIRELDDMGAYDLYDVLADLTYGAQPRTRPERAGAFSYKNEQWLDTLSQRASATIRAIAHQFEQAGTDSLENPRLFATPEVRNAGGLAALSALGNPAEVLQETKERMFSA